MKDKAWVDIISDNEIYMEGNKKGLIALKDAIDDALRLDNIDTEDYLISNIHSITVDEKRFTLKNKEKPIHTKVFDALLIILMFVWFLALPIIAILYIINFFI